VAHRAATDGGPSDERGLLGSFALAALVSFAERGFQQANRITLTKSRRCNNSSGYNLARASG
jgi:hypothetical protein